MHVTWVATEHTRLFVSGTATSSAHYNGAKGQQAAAYMEVAATAQGSMGLAPPLAPACPLAHSLPPPPEPSNDTSPFPPPVNILVPSSYATFGTQALWHPRNPPYLPSPRQEAHPVRRAAHRPPHPGQLPGRHEELGGAAGELRWDRGHVLQWLWGGGAGFLRNGAAYPTAHHLGSVPQVAAVTPFPATKRCHGGTTRRDAGALYRWPVAAPLQQAGTTCVCAPPPPTHRVCILDLPYGCCW